MADNERSPNYPALDLATAAALTKQLFEREGKSVAPYEAIAQALGSTSESVSGPYRSKIAALRQYGLIEKAGSGKAKLSQRGVMIGLREPNDPGYREALKESALTPSLFRDLWAKYSDGGTNANMRHYLVEECGFQVAGANRAIEAFRKTVDFANLSATSYNDEDEELEAESSHRTLFTEPSRTPGGSSARDRADDAFRSSADDRSSGGKVSYAYLADGINVQVTFDRAPTAKSIARIKAYLATMEEDLQDSESSKARSDDAPEQE